MNAVEAGVLSSLVATVATAGARELFRYRRRAKLSLDFRRPPSTRLDLPQGARHVVVNNNGRTPLRDATVSVFLPLTLGPGAQSHARLTELPDGYDQKGFRVSGTQPLPALSQTEVLDFWFTTPRAGRWEVDVRVDTPERARLLARVPIRLLQESDHFAVLVGDIHYVPRRVLRRSERAPAR